jgi:hypothetical protein
VLAVEALHLELRHRLERVEAGLEVGGGLAHAPVVRASIRVAERYAIALRGRHQLRIRRRLGLSIRRRHGVGLR